MAVLEQYVPSTAFTFSNSNLEIDIPWEFLSPDHIKLYRNEGTGVAPILESLYDVRGSRIFMTEGMLDEGETFYVRREVPLDQPWDATGLTKISPREIERALDRVIMAAQELQNRELFNVVTQKTQSIGYVQGQQGWLLGEDGTADITGSFRGTVAITGGVIDGTQVDILGVTDQRQTMLGFVNNELGTIDMPLVQGITLASAQRYLIVTVNINQAFGGVANVELQISRDGSEWFALGDAPDPTLPDSWKGAKNAATLIDGLNTYRGPLPLEGDGGNNPNATLYYVRARGVRLDNVRTDWSAARSVLISPIIGSDIANNSITGDKLILDAGFFNQVFANDATITATLTIGQGGQIVGPNFQLSSTGATIAGWIIGENAILSADDTVQIRSDNKQFLIKDAQEAPKAAFGYLGGIPGFGSNDYGLFLAPGNELNISSGGEFVDGSYLIKSDASYQVQHQSGATLAEFGSIGQGRVGFRIGRTVSAGEANDIVLVGKGLEATESELYVRGVIQADYLAPSGRVWDAGDSSSQITTFELDGGGADSESTFDNIVADDRTGADTGPFYEENGVVKPFHALVVDSNMYIREKLQIGKPFDQTRGGIFWNDEDQTLKIRGTLLAADGNFSGTITASTITGGSITGTTITGASITGTSSINIGPFVVSNDGAIQNIRFRNTDNLLFDNKTYAISATQVEEWITSPIGDYTQSGTAIEEPGSTWVRFHELANLNSISGTPANFFAENIAVGSGSGANGWLRVNNITGRGTGAGGTLIIRPAKNGFSNPNEEVYTIFGVFGPQFVRGDGHVVGFVNSSGINGAVFN